MDTEQKKEWKAPELTVYGTVVDITNSNVKYLNANDGYVLGSPQGPTIGFS